MEQVLSSLLAVIVVKQLKQGNYLALGMFGVSLFSILRMELGIGMDGIVKK